MRAHRLPVPSLIGLLAALVGLSGRAAAEVDPPAEALSEELAPRPEPRVRLDAWAGVHIYSGHPSLEYGAALGLRARVWPAGPLVLGASYRFSRFRMTDEERERVGRGRGGASVARDVDQHEVFVDAGFALPSFGLSASYGYLADESEDPESVLALGDAHVFGGIARVSLWGDVYVEASVARYDDGDVLRLSPSWGLPIAEGLTLTPRGAVQRFDGDTYGMGFLELRFRGDWGQAWLGGKAGSEVRPVYLYLPTAMQLADEVRGGAWAGVEVAMGRGASLLLSYDLSLLRSPVEEDGALVDEERAEVHTFVFGLGVSF